ncbi:aspartate aminotransferase family protein [Kitasatospora aureofaciens]|uniref:aspartate aminotransferase family protein n=1 Tax=Kitasatospora aureofaciens TaxID=1894 RepID=UPI0007C5AE46|nr:aminotransferase class III-fold pyridoxal phosphate-dependent enzyme [Kitasatospora aureofaciens]
MEELAERYLSQALSVWGLDVEYVRAEGDTMYLPGPDGGQRPVVDFVGGFGSLFFGHNHPELVAHATALLAAGTPSHAQLSRRTEAQRVAAALNTVTDRELSAGEPYEVVFANSGAEAVEAAVKHSELARVFRLGALSAELEAHAREVREAAAAAGADRPLALAPEAAELAGPGADADAVLAEAARHNAEALSRAPEFFALEGGFHGKLVGSLQLTHNPTFRLPFAALGARARFVPAGEPEEALKYVAAEQPYALDVLLRDGAVRVLRRPVPFVAGFVVEPVQGEGGIRELTAEQAARITEVCRALECPLIVDEIQSGAGRTGSFFASAGIGLTGDYYTLAKSVGGGLAKTSLLLVRRSGYVKEFELLHSSTYAKDSFSCAITEKVLEMLERDGGAAYRQAAERGARLRSALEEVLAEFGDVVHAVRGRGLLVGFEFADQSAAESPVIRNYARSGFFGFAVAGFLLRRHGLRLMPTGSAPHTLRIQPSYAIGDEAIGRLADGLRDVCTLLRNQDALRLVHALTGVDTPAPREDIRDFRTGRPGGATAPDPALRVAYVAELDTPDALRRFDPSLAGLDDATLRAFVARSAPVRALAPLPPVRSAGVAGDVEVTVFPLLVEEAPGAGAGTLPGDVAAQVGAARAAGHPVVVVSPRLLRLTGAPVRDGSMPGPAGFALPGGFGTDGDPALLPVELAEALAGTAPAV